MRKPKFSSNWPESWKSSYSYDLMEVFGDFKSSEKGYVRHYNNRKDRTISSLIKYVPLGSRVLDVAAAQGNFSILMAEGGYNVTWNDLRSDLADYVSMKHEFGALEFKIGNCFDIEFDRCFDAIVATEIIEHVAHPDNFISKLLDMLVIGGHLIITTPNGLYFNNKLPKFSECEDPSVYEEFQFKPNSDGHVFLLEPMEIINIVNSNNAEVIELSTYTSFVANGYLGFSNIIKYFPYKIISKLDDIISSLPIIANRLNTGMICVIRKTH